MKYIEPHSGFELRVIDFISDHDNRFHNHSDNIFALVSLIDGISTFIGDLMQKPLYKYRSVTI